MQVNLISYTSSQLLHTMLGTKTLRAAQVTILGMLFDLPLFTRAATPVTIPKKGAENANNHSG